MVYFIGNGSGIKIGFSDDPQARLGDIQVGNHTKLKLLAVIDGGREKERELHRLFKKYRVSGEWFRNHMVIRQYIDFADKLPIEGKAKPGSMRKLGKLRLAKNLTLLDMAKHLGITKQGVLDIEKRFELGAVTIGRLREYLDVLDIKMFFEDRKGRRLQ